MQRRKIQALLDRRHNTGEHGIALITTMLLLLLLTALTVSMVFSVRSDMLVNRYYRNYRGAFYAADSGLNIGRQAIANSLVANIPPTFAVGTAPLAPNVDATVAADVQNTYVNKGFVKLDGAGRWPESFQLTQADFKFLSCKMDVPGNCNLPPATAKLFTYNFGYALTSQGSSANTTERATLSDEGTVTITAVVTAASTKTSFAGWGMFIDQFPICSGTLVPGVISGPTFTNGAWNFGTGGSYTFTDTVGSVSPKAGYQFSGSCDQVAGPADKTIAPRFEAGFNLGQPHVDLPKNDFNQERAVLDGKGGNSAVTSSDLHNALRDRSGSSYPSGGTASGVFLPYDNSGGVNVFKGGGIFVQGNANITLTAGPGAVEIYTIVQGGKTTTVTVNPTAANALGNPQIPGITTIQDSSGTTTINGVPQNYDPGSGLPVGPATMLYVNGAISSLSGPAGGGAAIGDGQLITVTAASNVSITGDIKYRNPPAQLVTDPLTGLTSDQLTGKDTGQALGIFTANGDIQLNVPAKSPALNLEIDASLATLCDPSGGTCTGNGGLINTGGSIGTLTIIGGRIQNQIKNIGASTRNVIFDKRFSQDNFAPPWFPSTSLSITGKNSATPNKPVWRRTLWKNASNF
jgi:hypothetical protein